MTEKDEFSPKMRLFLARLSVSSSEVEAAKGIGIDASTPKKWKKRNPQFKAEVMRVKQQRTDDALAAINSAREEALRVIAGIGGEAARRLADYINVPVEKLSDRAKAVQVRAINLVLDTIGVGGKFEPPSGKINFLEIIFKLEKERQEKEKQESSIEAQFEIKE